MIIWQVHVIHTKAKTPKLIHYKLRIKNNRYQNTTQYMKESQRLKVKYKIHKTVQQKFTDSIMSASGFN